LYSLIECPEVSSDWLTDDVERCYVIGFVQTLESPGIKMLSFSGLESPGKVLEF